MLEYVGGTHAELSIDLRDASGDSMHFDENSIAKDGTSFRAQISFARRCVEV